MKVGNKIKSFFNSFITSEKIQSDIDNDFENLLERIIKEAQEETNLNYWYDMSQGKSATFNEIQTKDPNSRKELIAYLIRRINSLCIINRKNGGYTYDPGDLNRIKQSAYTDILRGLLRRDLKLSDQEIYQLFVAFKSSDEKAKVSFSSWPVTYVVQQIERKVKKKELSGEMEKYLKEILTWRQLNQPNGYWGTDIDKLKLRMNKLVFDAENDDKNVVPYILPEDGLGIFINATVSNLDTELRNKMYALFHLFLKASSSKPSQSFLKNTNAIIDEVGTALYKKLIHSFLNEVIQLKETETRHANGWVSREFLKDKNNVLVKGMIWSLSRFHDMETLNLVSLAAERCFKKIPGVGPAAAGVGNACIYTLGNSKGLEGISHLSRLKLKIKQNSTRSLIEKYLETASTKMGISASEIEEISIPDFGLTFGRRTEKFDDYQFLIEVEDIGKVNSSWIKPDGKTQKSVPSFVKDSARLSAKLKKIKGSISKIKKYLTAQRDRIDRLYLEDRVWNYENLEKHYIGHGMVSFIARKLIWEIKIENQWIAIYFQESRWYNIKDAEVNIHPESELRLWHPCNATTDQVLEWRNKFQNLQIKQPLKQAYREVYILTDAEVSTQSYSNRMAAHILKQHQFNALAALRGWKYSLMGAFDNGVDSERATINLRAYKMQAQFWINELNAEDAMNDTGIWTYIATDQVRFVDLDQEPINLIDVPPIVFSEIMRNVDLFVGVASVGNDPEWRDNGGLVQYGDYWTSYSFGDLNEIAKTRKVILENLLPRLKINKFAKIEGKYLVVKGKVRTYKIHIGSTNILMEPNDQYLCIVPDRSAPKTPNNVFLPFEGDRGLSLVLSKAFLLVDDDKVTDQTILNQIHQK